MVKKSLGLKGKSEWAGARKLLAALKQARKIKGPVRLVPNPAASVTRHPRRRHSVTRSRNIAGFMRGGVFHPIRSGERMITYRGQRVLVKDEHPYSRRKAGEKAKRRNTTYASFMRQGRKRKRSKTNPRRLTKKQEFLRRMRLGRLRAARARGRSRQ